MTDIVERLRALYATHPIIMEAADEIERLHKIELQFDALKEERVRWSPSHEL